MLISPVSKVQPCVFRFCNASFDIGIDVSECMFRCLMDDRPVRAGELPSRRQYCFAISTHRGINLSPRYGITSHAIMEASGIATVTQHCVQQHWFSVR